ncbi:hypothetical protein GCM10010378_60490 [Streptomyces viridochromogenes]
MHDNWGQTGTGSIMIANFAAGEILPGSMGRPLPGVEATVLAQGEDGRALVVDGRVTEVHHAGTLRDDGIAEEVRRLVVAYLIPMPGSAVQAQVLDGVVRLRGRIRDASPVPAAAQLVRAVEGVVDVDCELTAQDAPAV